ncbi:Phox-like protein [Pseudovirgaria hyperparasitica]|uniref:Phox-like protein n=1 Tax=Pseudovirgaria hyperparasitica TaxID=470096 RepID=A0A6A6W617_9PEZI|nr:Phox-like protein [Pseudovirgaria hyperparasitica]KAF2758053.1 Phox-like protein [Pseudovirgaria hyperparasitica]
MSPPREITIPITSTTSDAKPYTLYHIRVAQPNSLRHNIQKKRYSEFTDLNTALHSQTGSYPPASLPAKSWFARTVNNAELTGERRRGLETYLKEIEKAIDSKWKNAPAYREFLGLNDESSATDRLSSAVGSSKTPEIRTASAWLDTYAELKTKLQQARLFLTRREQATSPATQNDASVNAKKCLMQASSFIMALESGLALLSGKKGTTDDGGWAIERLGDGEIRRRRDMISTAKKEREGLDGVLSAAIPSPALQDAKASLFQGSSIGQSSRRVLGAPKETERTRELDNEGVLQLQKQIMQEQDEDVFDLTKAVRRMKEMGIQINEELHDQNELLEMLDGDVERVDGKIRIANKRMNKIK